MIVTIVVSRYEHHKEGWFVTTPLLIDIFTRTINKNLSIKIDIVSDIYHWYDHKY